MDLDYSILARVILASLPALYGLFLFPKKNKLALPLLLLSALLLRLVFISFDPFLHNWDERYHALVAKHLMDYPLKPMLWLEHMQRYDADAWCCNHIWLHKPPLFMWLMALSMKIFSPTVFFMRLPSALMGTLSVYFTYVFANKWSGKRSLAFMSAFLICFSFYHLELISGRIGLDHNDIAFAFFINASIWALIKYQESSTKLKWAILIGVLVGCAILTKWLTALVVFGAWFLANLYGRDSRKDFHAYAHLLLALLISIIVFMPWQLFIMEAYPVESGLAYQHFSDHLFTSIGIAPKHKMYYLEYLTYTCGSIAAPLVTLGILMLLFSKQINNKYSIIFLSIFITIYSFFTFISKTKMPGLVHPAYSILIVLIAAGYLLILDFINALFRYRYENVIYSMGILLMSLYLLRPAYNFEYRSTTNTERNRDIDNTEIYKKLDEKKLANRVVLNVKDFEDVEFMFHQNLIAYRWYPDSITLDSLMCAGHKFAAFKSHTHQPLPNYIKKNPEIVILKDQLK